MSVSVADSNSVCSFEGDQLSCNIRDECSSYVQKTNKVRYKDGSTDAIVDKEPLSCVASQRLYFRRVFPHRLLWDPPLHEAEKPKCRPVLKMRARPPVFLLRTLKRRAPKGNKKGKGKGGNKRTMAQAGNAGDVGSPKKRRLGKAEASGTGTHNAPPGEAGKQRVEHSSSEEDNEADLYYLTKNDKDFYYFNTGSDCKEQPDDEDPDWEP